MVFKRQKKKKILKHPNEDISVKINPGINISQIQILKY